MIEASLGIINPEKRAVIAFPSHASSTLKLTIKTHPIVSVQAIVSSVHYQTRANYKVLVSYLHIKHFMPVNHIILQPLELQNDIVSELPLGTQLRVHVTEHNCGWMLTPIISRCFWKSFVAWNFHTMRRQHERETIKWYKETKQITSLWQVDQTKMFPHLRNDSDLPSFSVFLSLKTNPVRNNHTDVCVDCRPMTSHAPRLVSGPEQKIYTWESTQNVAADRKPHGKKLLLPTHRFVQTLSWNLDPAEEWRLPNHQLLTQKHVHHQGIIISSLFSF